MKLGADYNASRPVDGDFVRHPTGPQLAEELRTTKTRLKEFFAVLFDLDLADFLDNVIPSAALTDSPQKPSSEGVYYRRTTVDERGFVTSGSAVGVYTGPRLFRAFFSASGSETETPDGLVTEVAPAIQATPRRLGSTALRFIPQGRRYTFTAPAGVTRVRVTLVGGGLRGAGDVPQPENWQTNVVSLVVVPSESYEVFVAAPDGISYISNKGYTKYSTSEGFNVLVIPGAEDLAYRTFFQTARPLYRGYGGSSESGMVLIEWYA